MEEEAVVHGLTMALRAMWHESVEIRSLDEISSGASRETWSFVALRDDGARRKLILQRSLPGSPLATPMSAQVQCLQAAHAAGVPVPPVVASSQHFDAHFGLGHFVVLDHIEGETLPRRIFRTPELEDARRRFAADCGTVLARLHSISLDAVPDLEFREQLSAYRETYDSLGQAHPAFELAFRWLSENKSDHATTTIVHGDFRMGNLIVGEDGIRAVIDWELSHAGHPMEDLGWLCVKAWRFGRPLVVGGLGSREELFNSYERTSGTTVDPGEVRWWEVFGTLKWGVICIIQTMRYIKGDVQSVELAAVGRRVAEVEHDLLALLRKVGV